MVGELTVMVGPDPSVTVATAVPIQPFASVPVMVYEVVLAGETVIEFVVAPVDQEYVEAPEALKVAVAPKQIVGEFTVIIGKEFTVTVATAVPVQPLASFPVTVYEVVDVGETVIGFVVAPVDQEYVEPPAAVNVAAVPAQVVGELTVIVGKGFTITVTVAVPLLPSQPVPSVPETV
jgi:hypothetical protein